jgi:hypothetical protein
MKHVVRSLESLNHTADLGGRIATSILLEPSNESVECVGLLGRLVIGGSDSGGLRLSWCGRRRGRSSFSCGWVAGTTLRFDALGVVGVPFMAFET